ncbi:hypothetical protein [Streptomyces sp. NPDC086147]|uniref:hypothetical protein n=1 Tax=Streptomyces sp. NPDC086147 TaxID=3155295 RepID=UPI00344CC30A
MLRPVRSAQEAEQPLVEPVRFDERQGVVGGSGQQDHLGLRERAPDPVGDLGGAMGAAALREQDEQRCAADHGRGRAPDPPGTS